MFTRLLQGFPFIPPHLTQQTELAKKDDLYSEGSFLRIAEMDNKISSCGRVQNSNM